MRKKLKRNLTYLIMSVDLVNIFNDQFSQFLEDVLCVFPENLDIVAGKNAYLAIRKANPKLMIQIWFALVYAPYKNQIDSGDIGFFVTKDYTTDLSQNANSKKIMEVIDSLRCPVRDMSPENQSKVMKYLQNLSKLSVMFSLKNK
jgi:hypothetical protein